MIVDIGKTECELFEVVRTQLRRCLGCTAWMNSTHVGHRRCNHCKGYRGPFYLKGPGARIHNPDVPDQRETYIEAELGMDEYTQHNPRFQEGEL